MVGKSVHCGQTGPMSVVYVVKCPVVSVVTITFPVSVSVLPAELVVTNVVGNRVH